jgi:hypothetical protein
MVVIDAAPGGGSFPLAVTAIKTTTPYAAAANEYVIIDTTSSGPFVVNMPSAPPNGTLLGGRLVGFGTNNFVTFTPGGTDVFNKPGGPANASNVLQTNNQGVLYEYYNGVWYMIGSAWPVGSLNTLYLQTATQVTSSAVGTIVSTNVQAALGEIDSRITNLPTLTTSNTGKVPISTVGSVTTLNVDDLAQISSRQYLRLTADGPTVNNSTTNVTDTAVTMTLVANAVYEMRGTFIWTSSAVADVKFNFTFPAGTAVDLAVMRGHQGTASVPQANDWTYLPANASNVAMGCTGAANGSFCKMEGLVRVGSTAGSLGLTYAQLALEVSDTIRKAGSYLILERVV